LSGALPFETLGTPLMWGGFLAFVLVMLALDLGVFHRNSHAVSLREAATLSVVWVALAGIFNVLVYFWFGGERALEFATGYVLEKALAVDNLFVFALILGHFAVPREQQHRVLFYGVLGALILRAIFIAAGSAFVQRFHWATYVFGGILLITGVKLMFEKETAADLEKNMALRILRRIVPVKNTYVGGNFTVVENGRRYATPLLVALVLIEGADVVFAVDSVPAVLAVTTDPFIVFTSNVFAILGLRSMFFLLAGVLDKFHYLKIGLSLVLVFVGAKMVLAGTYKIPIAVALGVVAAILGISIAASIIRPARPEKSEGDAALH
jgi:tellurite resistance protein TerC